MTNEPSHRVDFIDYIRGVAILSVFLFHSLQSVFHFSSLPWNGWLRDFAVSKMFLALLPLSFGWAGVSIFFVVSGFCIHVSFQVQGREWGSFFIRRFFRIYPPYLMAIILFTVLFFTTQLRWSSDTIGWRQAINHLLLIHNFDPASYYAINPSFWTIAIEAQLYLLYPLLLLLVKKCGWQKTMIAVALCELLIRSLQSAFEAMLGAGITFGFRMPHFMYHIMPAFHWLTVLPLSYWFSWSLGAFIADAHLAGRALPFVKSSARLWLVLTVTSYFVRPLAPFFFVLVALLTATVISKLLSGYRPKIPIPHFCLDHLRQTGVWSYSIYLIHQPLVGLYALTLPLIFIKPENYLGLRFLLCAASWLVIMPLGGIWYRLFELPSIALGKRIIKR